MPKKYHIHIRSAPPRFHPVGKYTTVEFREDCAGSCRECVKKKCVYNIFKDDYQHITQMDEPEYLYECQSCFRCVQECTRGIFSRVINPEYRRLGDDYWKADIVHRTWYQAHTGKIPVSGAGYRGPFVGRGFDAMWTDMSEIVRPTRDGIHGREYINTCIELTRRPMHLAFNADGSLACEVPPIFEIPLPVLFYQPDFGVLSENVLQAVVRAACDLGTLAFIQPEYYSELLSPYVGGLVPCLTPENWRDFLKTAPGIEMVALSDGPGVEAAIAEIRTANPAMVIAVNIPLDAAASERALALARTEVDTLHLRGDDHGREVGTDRPRFIREMIREVHLRLVQDSIRNKVNLIFSGGIAMAEHMAKAIICGADGVAVDNSLLIALECRLCMKCTHGKRCPVRLDQIDPEWGRQRIINLMAAWRNQLLEVMGAMGIRETRRLRGEVGRAMGFEDLEAENFGPLFGERKVSGLE